MIELIKHHKLLTGLAVYFSVIGVMLAVLLWNADDSHTEPM